MLSLRKRIKLMKEVDFGISMDLIVEILKKLPAKSLVRFRSVSKQWSTIIGNRKDFIESIVTRPLSQPPQKLPLFIFHHSVHDEPFFTVSSIISQSSKPVVSLAHRSTRYQYARGLICCYSPETRLVTIYNPTTRQSFPLPEIKYSPIAGFVERYCYFGYDPIMNQYKVLIISFEKWKQTYHVFTLERGQSWREIKYIDEKEKFYIRSRQVCIDGTIYFLARNVTKEHKSDQDFLLSFNIRSERFDRVWAPEILLRALSTRSCNYVTLVNYLGKLGCIYCIKEDTSLWIMDNAEKQEWSGNIFWFPKDLLKISGRKNKFSGVTPTGEIFVSPCGYNSDKSFYVYFYNMKQHSFRRVKIKDTSLDQMNEPFHWIQVFAIHDHVENTMWL